MAIFNLKKKEIECKVVYYGPGRCGKTTNLEYIFKSYKKQVVAHTPFLIAMDQLPEPGIYLVSFVLSSQNQSYHQQAKLIVLE